jgi:hypothetical protein
MRFAWVLAAALVLAACGQESGPSPAAGPEGGPAASAAAAGGEGQARPAIDYKALSGYDDGWFLSPGWPGEYPPGFAVLDSNVKVPGRARPNPGDPQDVSCLLPQYANYQIWNTERTAGDKLEFFVATKKVAVNVLEDAEVEYVGANGLVPLSLKKGDQLTYLRYIGEGYTVMSFKGQEFDINEGELHNITDLANARLEEDLWVRVPCLGGGHAWLLFDEVVREKGIYPSPITGYGEAADILPGDVDAIREQAGADMYGLETPGQEIIPPPEE